MRKAAESPVLDLFRAQPASPEDEAAFEAHRIAHVALYGRTTALVLNVLHLLWWPTDMLLLPMDSAVRAGMNWFRATTFTNHSVFFVLLWLPALRRYAVPLAVLGVLISCVFMGIGMAHLGPLDQPYFHLTYITPIAVAGFPLRPLQRIVTSVLIAATLYAGYFSIRPEEIHSRFIGVSLGCMLFAVAAAVACGQILFVLMRRTFLSERALERSAEALRDYGERLEDKVAERGAELRRLAAHLERLSEEERGRMSRELHDELGQQLTAMRYTISSARGRVRAEPERVEAGLGELEDSLAQLAGTVRNLVSELRPRILDDLGLGPAVQWLTEQTEERAGIPCDLESSIDPAVTVRPALAIAVFRIVQESLTNAMRHAGARRLRVVLTVDATGLRARIEDNGRGLDPARPSSRGMGLLGMRERARAHGGRLEIAGRPGAGTTVSVELPLTGGEEP